MNFYNGNLPAGTAAPTGVDESMRRWAEHNGCDSDYVEERVSPEVRQRTWQGCDAPTVLYVVDNGGHAWPGKPAAGVRSLVRSRHHRDRRHRRCCSRFFFDAER